MISPPLAVSEEQRLIALRKYEILDTLPEQVFDDLVFLASHICDTPIALISFVDTDRQWFKARLGLDAAETPREISFCGHAILQNELFVVNDTLQDQRFRGNPLVTENPNIRFYAGAPLTISSGENVGTLCIIDTVPRRLSVVQRQGLLALSRQAVNQLDLRLTSQEAQSAVQAKSLFLANMSHEIRTPMNAISSCTGLLIDSIDDQQQLQLLKLMRDASNNLLTLINDVLDFSKMEFESIELRDEPFELHKMLIDIVSILGTRAKENGRNIGLDIADSVPEWIRGDANRLRQIIFNLAGNAIKFCFHTVTVSLSTQVFDTKEMLLIKFRDDGKGISVEEQKTIFHRFSQVNVNAKEGDGGTGLGLSICKSLCHAMQGKISIDSAPGSGTTFSLELPLNVVEAIANKVEQIPLSRIAPDMGREHPLRILVADDSDANKFIITALLEKLGYCIDTVSDGSEAFEAVRCGEYDVILMDIQMPKMNGVEATLRIRESAIKQPVIIALTANAFEEDKALAMEAGMDDFLTKPINLEALAKTLSLIAT